VSGSSPSGDTARTLILVGLILDVIFEMILLALGVLLLAVTLIGGLLLGFGVIGLIWIFLVYVFSYQPVREGDYEGARTATLVFAILSLITLALIPGILFLIAYVKLGDAIREEPNVAPAWGTGPTAPIPAYGAAAGGGKICSHCGRSNPATGLYCQGCGAPLG
jgi:hypothetical protein